MAERYVNGVDKAKREENGGTFVAFVSLALRFDLQRSKIGAEQYPPSWVLAHIGSFDLRCRQESANNAGNVLWGCQFARA
jgi:hypothetical protein